MLCQVYNRLFFGLFCVAVRVDFPLFYKGKMKFDRRGKPPRGGARCGLHFLNL